MTLCDGATLCGVRGAVHSQSGHDSVTLGRNSGKESSGNIAAVSLIGGSSPPTAWHTSRNAAALYGGLTLLKFNVFVPVTALTKRRNT